MNIDWLTRSKALEIKVRNFVGGRWAASRGDHVEKRGPRDGRVLSRFGAGDAQDVNEAISITQRAFEDGRWSGLSAQRRMQVMHEFASLIERHRDELALLECLDVGKPITNALNFDIPKAAEIIRFNAAAADKIYGKVYGTDRSSLSYQLRQPIGVVAGIVGWNFPLLLAAGKIGPALATGNCLVLKPSELTSFTTARVAELAIEAGVPEGVFNVIHGDARVGAALARHGDVDLVTFTGSSSTGKKLLIAAGESNMKRLVLECGGKAPNIVFDDAPNLEAVADAVAVRAFYNQGEVCTASSRLLIQDRIKDQFLSILLKKVAKLLPGDPLNVDSSFGAVVSEGHRQKILGYIDSGEKEGARKVYQSDATAPIEGGFYVAPVIFDGVSCHQRIAKEEIFGPVLSVITFRDEEEAIRVANSTIYGLSTIIWTKDPGRAHRMTHRIKAGWITVNATSQPIGGTGIGVMAVGGQKQSGMGVEGGLEGLEEYTSRTAVQWFV
jgi:acyl-CoA reductase-like NAD-dependent aldehyde dehydrogenase